MNPDQHTLPKVGFGNLIALSLQKEARQLGCSVFVDDDLEPYAPPSITLILAKRLHVERSERPEPRINRLIRLGGFCEPRLLQSPGDAAFAVGQTAADRLR
ncbi:MAG: TOTE conflict system archaeo-eukaryotic primase domain-containing protein [Cyanobacteriota bacterium]